MSLLRQNILYLQHNYLIHSDNHRLQLQVVVASNSGKFEIITLKIWRRHYDLVNRYGLSV
jgi:hypothetical protein